MLYAYSIQRRARAGQPRSGQGGPRLPVRGEEVSTPPSDPEGPALIADSGPILLPQVREELAQGLGMEAALRPA